MINSLQSASLDADVDDVIITISAVATVLHEARLRTTVHGPTWGPRDLISRPMPIIHA